MSQIVLCVGCEIQYLGQMYEISGYKPPLIFLKRINDGVAKTVNCKGINLQPINDNLQAEITRSMNVYTTKRCLKYKVVFAHKTQKPDEIEDIVWVTHIKVKSPRVKLKAET